ncbi:MAG: glycosyltransferase family protein, partial [Terriglobales bacterium]
TAHHNRLNASARLVLNLNRDRMAACGFSPPTRIFEAAGAGACVVTDAWPGIEQFFTPGEDIVVVATPEELQYVLRTMSAEAARAMGARMRRRALREHSYVQRAAQVDAVLRSLLHARFVNRPTALHIREA